MEEIWKDIPDYEGIYQASNLGNVRSFNNRWKLKGKPRLLKMCINDRGYMVVGLLNNGKQKTFKVHILIAMTFLNHKPDKTLNIVVDHIDCNKKNNSVSNLQLITNRQNLSKDKKNGTSKYVGVSWHKPLNKWVSFIYINKKRYNLGYYNCELAAAQAYQNKLQQLNNN